MYIEIKLLTPQDSSDFADLIQIFALVFEQDDIAIPRKAYLTKLLDKPDFLVIVAKDEGKVIGGLTIHILHSYYAEKPVAYIYDVGVAPQYQRKGIGKMLISYLIDYCKQNNFEEAYVEAEYDDTHAINFYRQTPFSSELQAIHFTYSFDE
jgi:aminoglycoside 3-N-acetyltransferase I